MTQGARDTEQEQEETGEGDTGRLTAENNARTWKLFQAGWYANIFLALLSLFVALFFFSRLWHGMAGDIAAAAIMMMSFVIIACVLLLGAGVSRYQARLESQHLELKLAINRMASEIQRLKDGTSEGEHRNEDNNADT